MKALVGAFNQEKALVGAFSVIVQPVVEPMEHYTALVQTFLSSYRRLLVHTAHRRGAPATGGMAASIVTGAAAVEAVTRDKRREIEAGVDGFLIYDLALAAPCRQLWADMEKQQQNLNGKFFN